MNDDEVGSYEHYVANYTNPEGGELIEYNYWSQQGILDPNQQEAAQDIQDQLDDKNTAAFYEKYGLTPP